MPELHKLTPALGVLMDRGHRVALVTDGRMSGGLGPDPRGAPLHARSGGGRSALEAPRRRRHPRRRGYPVGLRSTSTSTSREPWIPEHATHGTGRELFAAFRERVGRPDAGASVFSDFEPDEDLTRMTAIARETDLTVEYVVGPRASRPGGRDRGPRERSAARAGRSSAAACRRSRSRCAPSPRWPRSSGSPPRSRAPSSAPALFIHHHAAARRRARPPARASSSPRARRRPLLDGLQAPAACRSYRARRPPRTWSR